MITFDEPIVIGRFVKRYQRFFMDVILDNNEIVVAHTPNTGSMLGLLSENNRVMISRSNDPKRRTAFTAEAIEVEGAWVGINTQRPNKLVHHSLMHPTLSYLSTYRAIKREVPFGQDARSRVDFYFFESKEQAPLFLEIKNVTLRKGDIAQFPDAPSLRARKHIDDLLYTKSLGFNAGLLFIVQRMDCTSFKAATDIDKDYALKLKEAHDHGLSIKAISARVNETGIELAHELPCIF